MRKINALIKMFLLRNVYQWRWLHKVSGYKIRPAIVRYCGAKIGKNVYMSHDIYFDNHLEYLTIEDDVLLSPKVVFIFHKRNMVNFKYGSKYNQTPHIMKPIVVSKNSAIGTGAILLPGVTIEEGANIGAGAVVTKDIPAWSIAAGNPAKVIKQFKPNEF